MKPKKMCTLKYFILLPKYLICFWNMNFYIYFCRTYYVFPPNYKNMIGLLTHKIFYSNTFEILTKYFIQILSKYFLFSYKRTDGNLDGALRYFIQGELMYLQI